MNDRSVPWLILVPERPGVTEIHELSPDDRTLLIEEISRASHTILRLYGPEKINIGMLGNIVSQLHIHVIARYKADRAWPDPIWGTGPALPYDPEGIPAVIDRLRTALVAE
jgi:diadenosine tetraphosphate (Ap4A) HIT family hydrolase